MQYDLPVTLVSPRGYEEEVNDAERANNLIVGFGYTIKKAEPEEPEAEPEPAVDSKPVDDKTEAKKPATKPAAKDDAK